MIATAIIDYLFRAFAAVSKSSSVEESCKSIFTYWEPSGFLCSEEGRIPVDRFHCCTFCRQSDESMQSFCLLISMELILILNCSLWNFHSNDLNCLK